MQALGQKCSAKLKICGVRFIPQMSLMCESFPRCQQGASPQRLRVAPASLLHSSKLLRFSFSTSEKRLGRNSDRKLKSKASSQNTRKRSRISPGGGDERLEPAPLRVKQKTRAQPSVTARRSTFSSSEVNESNSRISIETPRKSIQDRQHLRAEASSIKNHLRIRAQNETFKKPTKLNFRI